MKTFSNGDIGPREREILSAMVMDSATISRVAPKWEPGGMMFSPAANVVGKWCVDYCRKHHQAPGPLIASLFRDWTETKQRREEEVELIDRFLSGLDLSPKKDANSEYFIDLAGRHFEEVKFRKMLESATAHLDAGGIDKAKAAVAKHQTVRMSDSSGIDLFNDREEILATFADPPESIVKYNIPSIDRFMESQLERGGFISFIAPNKTGKSFWLLDFAWRSAVLMGNRRKTAFFLVGDMTKKQFNRRFYSRTAVHPYKNPTREWPYEVSLPESIRLFRDGDCIKARLEHDVRMFDRLIDPEIAMEACNRITEHKIKSNRPWIRLSVHPGGGLNTLKMRDQLVQWDNEGFTPDCIVVDYADNLGHVDSKADRREQINDTWLDLSAIRLERHCLMVTATQCDAKGFNVGWLTRDNFSEDRRKLDHVSGFIGLNMSREDKAKGVTRINWVNVREGEFGETDGCWVAGNLAVCNPAMVASFPRGGDPVDGDHESEEETDVSRNGRHKQRRRI